MIATTIEKDTLSEIGAPKVITSDAQNERYIAALLQLEKKSHPTAAERDFAKLLTVLIEAYEEDHYSVRDASPIEVLAELMQANNLIQKDLVSMFGTESMASMVLNGKRPLSLEHAVALGRRFHISPAAFIPKK